MHPWHDIAVDETKVDVSFPVVIEVPKGSKNKYEIDKDTGLLFLDRVLHSAVHYPADYGFIPQTLCGDGDALDVLVLCQVPLVPGCVVMARAVGVLNMTDDKGVDVKIIAVCVNDPVFSDYQKLEDVPKHMLREIEQFFNDYKILEGKGVEVDAPLGLDEAKKVIADSFVMYRESEYAK